MAKVFLCCAFLFFGSVLTAEAAEFQVISEERAWTEIWGEATPKVCNVRMDGPVIEGDADRFKQLASIAEGGGNICLNSPGGDYYEGLAIAHEILKKGIVTIIEADSFCYSACAIIFMAGNQVRDGTTIPERWLHINGLLGFHAPYIKGVAQQNYSSTDLEAAYRNSIQAIRDLTRLGKEQRFTVIPQEILTELLANGPNELMLIDTVFKAYRSKIQLLGGPVPELNVTARCNACEMLHVDPRGVDFNKPPTRCSATRVDRRGSQFWFYGYGAELSEYCVAQIPGNFGRKFAIYTEIVASRNARLSDSKFNNWLPYWNLYAPSTKIARQ